MSHSIANTSTSTSAPTARLPTVEEINGWNRDRVKGFLQEKKDSLDLDDTEIDKIYNNKVDGNTFLELTRDDLLSIGIVLKPAKEIGKLISQIRGEQPVADVLITEMANQLKFIYENLRTESETASFSSINKNRFQRFLEFARLSVKVIDFNGKYPQSDIEPYKRNSHTENNQQQRNNILEYFNTHLKPILPDSIVIQDVANKNELLNIRKGAILPYNLRGGTDLILAERSAIDCKIPKLGIRAIIEFKKEVEEKYIPQATLEMIVADCLVHRDIKVFGVLTDLKEDWQFIWMGVNKEIVMVTLKHRKTAFDVINKMVRSSYPRISGISNTERMKYLDLFDGETSDDIANDDVAPMEDFYDQMDEEEVLMHKTKKMIYALKDNPIFSSILSSPSDSFSTEI